MWYVRIDIVDDFPYSLKEIGDDLLDRLFGMDNTKENGGVPVDGEESAQDSAQLEGSHGEENQVNSGHTMNGDNVDAGGQGST